MKHYIYKTSSPSGKFYIGRHSTKKENDTYLGSGKWIKQIKDKSILTVEILKYANSFEELLLLEEQYILQFINDPNNMNYNNKSTGWASGDLSWAHTEEAKSLKKKLRLGKSFDELYGKEKSIIIKEKIGIKAKGRKKDKAWNTGLTKETSQSVKSMSDSKIGKSPWNKGLNTGISTFSGKEHTESSIKKMREKQRLNRIQNRITCENCGKNLDKANYVRYHGDKCKSK